MNMWCHLPTGFIKRYLLQFVGVVVIVVALVTTVLLAPVSNAVYSTNRPLSFQGRLLTASGAVVADGHYNMQFKIYEGGTGTAVNNPGGTLRWTESHVNASSQSGIEVRNGYFSVSLGIKNPFGSSIDWNSDTLWLSMNIAGSADACSTFGTAPCTADGEMLPMKQITATPYALNAGAIGGKTADNFVQLGQGVQNDASLNTSSIHINKTGSGNLVQLQNAGTDVFTVTDTGNIELGSGDTRTISIGSAQSDQTGDDLIVQSGQGGSGSGSNGGSLFLQGGSAGGDNADGGDVSITGGSGAGTGKSGSVYIGASNTDSVQIGDSNLTAGTQNIAIGNSDAAGGTTNITIGNGGNAAGGSTTIQAKDDVTIKTDGETRATFDNTNTLYLGNGIESDTPTDFRIQGTSSTGTNVNGGTVSVQGGNATAGNANGGNLVLGGGTGNGTGSNGLVVINAPTYATSSVQAAATSTDITQATIDAFGVAKLNATADNVVFTVPAPSLGANAAGRILYVVADGTSRDFYIRANALTTKEFYIRIAQSTSTQLIWDGESWVSVGGGNTSLQSTYTTSIQTTGQATMDLTGSTGAGGLTLRDSEASPVVGPLLTVQGANSNNLFSVNSNVNELASNPGAENPGGSATTFPASTWTAVNSATISRSTEKVASGSASVRVNAMGAYDGVENSLKTTLQPNTRYNVSFGIWNDGGAFDDLGVYYSQDGSPENYVTCGEDENALSIVSERWVRITCTFTTPASGITAGNTVGIDQGAAATRTFYVDNLSVTPSGNAASPAEGSPATSNVQIGGGQGGGSTTLFTLDRAASPTESTNHEALLGSMYYDTTLGKVQCYEAEGWGSCSESPDTFISLNPEFGNAVIHGSGIGTLTSDICSDALNINDGSSSQPSICGTNETNNFYKWTTPEATTQTRSIFVTHQLPSTFKKFTAGLTTVTARTDSANATVDYQIYRNNSESGLTACGTTTTASTGVKTSWQTVAASGAADPTNCNFAAGDSIVIRINMSASSNVNAYLSTLKFVHSNQ